MKQSKPILHARDHEPGGADPIDFPSDQSPPWFQYSVGTQTTFVTYVPSTGGGDTNPTVVVNYAWIMAQTSDGATVADGGTLVQHGTVLGNLDVKLQSLGSLAGDSNGVFQFPVSSAPGTYGPANLGLREIGSGMIRQASTLTQYKVAITSKGYVVCPGIPDISPPSGAQNTVRIDWPWPWAVNDLMFSGTFLYPMVVD